FTIRIERGGFKRWKRTYSGKRIEATGRIDVNLEELSLSAMPLGRDDRAKARVLDQALARANAELTRAKASLKRAESELDRAQQGQQTIAQASGYHRIVETARSRFERAELARDEAQDAVDSFRDAALSRLGETEKE